MQRTESGIIFELEAGCDRKPFIRTLAVMHSYCD